MALRKYAGSHPARVAPRTFRLPAWHADLDRVCHARFADGVTPIQLAGRARTALSTVSANDPINCVTLLGRS
jgi:hypothetical protein